MARLHNPHEGKSEWIMLSLGTRRNTGSPAKGMQRTAATQSPHKAKSNAIQLRY